MKQDTLNWVVPVAATVIVSVWMVILIAAAGA